MLMKKYLYGINININSKFRKSMFFDKKYLKKKLSDTNALLKIFKNLFTISRQELVNSKSLLEIFRFIQNGLRKIMKLYETICISLLFPQIVFGNILVFEIRNDKYVEKFCI